MKRPWTLLLLRHAKAVKNEQRRHGGSGTALLSEGLREAMALANTLAIWEIQFQRILFSARPQCADTSEVLSSALGISMQATTALEPVFLGVLDGLSEKEAVQRYPEAAARMQAWRAGQAEICELLIPEMDSPLDFYERGRKFVASCAASQQATVVVATRSVLVLLASVLLGRTPTPGGGYIEIPWPPLAYLCFSMQGAVATLNAGKSSVEVSLGCRSK